MIIAILLIVFGIFAAASAVVLFDSYKKTSRERKNYERALKLVPLLIHLPPMSEDIEMNGRDARDIVDENISKAQVIYNILSSTIQKTSFKTNLYGQRHISLEVVGNHGLVYFYAMVPITLVDVVKQAIISAYTSAQVEEVFEYNIFNPVGKTSGVSGGELILKKEFAYPIATYRDVKRDTMQSLLNALSTLDKEDGACIQILLRPADPKWHGEATAIANHKRKGTKSASPLQHAGNWARQFAVAFAQPPDAAGQKKDNKPELSNLDQATVDAIDDKTRHPGYETKIRVIVSSNVSRRSQAILANIVAAFALFDAPGRNGFKYVAAASPEAVATDYILRSFPQQDTKLILNAVELATLFHFPDQRNIPTSQLRRQESKQVDAPRNMPTGGLLLGYNIFRGMKKAIRLDIHDRQRHMYVVGQTGTGKSTFLENLALQDMLNGDGFAFVDPHGDTVEKLLSMVPRERTEDVIYFSPADMEYPMGVNIFEYETPHQKDFLIQEALNMLYKLYDPQHSGIMGPRYEHLFRNAALAVMADPAGGTFIDIPKLFRDPKYVQQKLKFVTDQTVREFWEKEMPQSQRSNEFGDVVSWFVSKFGAFLSNEMMRNIIGQTKSAFNLREIMDNKKILLVNLSKGRTGELNSKLLGMFFVMKFHAAAMSRANIPEDERKDFALYVDEFQNFSTDSFATIMSEARKYHLNLIVANQYTTQLTPEIRDAVFGNMGTIVSFRVGPNDVDTLSEYFKAAFSANDLLRVPNYNTITRTMVNGIPTQPFSMATLPPLGTPNPKLADALKQLSAVKYGKPKILVEEEIFARMKTIEPPKPAFNSGFGASPRPWSAATPAFGAPATAANPVAPFSSVTPPAAAAPAAAGSGSFLDDWLAKRRAPATAATATPLPATPQTSFAPSPPAASAAPLAPAIEAAQPAAKPTPNTPVQADIFINPRSSAAAVITPNGAGDTIYIDKEGALHSHDDDASPAATPTSAAS